MPPPLEHRRTPIPTTFAAARVGETIGPLSFDPNEALRLSQLDIEQRRRELARNLEGFKGEVLDDIPVSHRYHYYFDGEGNVFNHPDRQPIHRFEHQFDPRERDGTPQIGFKKATDILFHNPEATVFWLSPAGPATLDQSLDNPYRNVPFIYGQLYVMNFDGEKITGVAVKVDPEGESAIRQFLPEAFAEADAALSDYDRITTLIQSPGAFSGSILDFASQNWKDGVVYRGKAEQRRDPLTVRGLTARLVEAFHNLDEQKPNEFDRLVDSIDPRKLTDKNALAQIYLQLILNHSSVQSNGKISLMGACGGSEVNRSDIEALLGIANGIDSVVQPTSSLYRLLTQGNVLQQLLKSNESKNFVCPNCGAEATGPIGNQCPSCKITRDEWAKKGNEVC